MIAARRAVLSRRRLPARRATGVASGTGAERQLAVFAATADIRAVTRTIAAETSAAAALS